MTFISAVPALTEVEVRHLCGQATYARAAAFQAAGHVLRPTITDLTLSADVRGTWRRIDQVQVEAGRNQLMASCSCGSPRWCAHAGALLLHWLRSPASFDTPADRSALDLPDPLESRTPPTELLYHLQRCTLERLREIARRRGIRLAARSKVDVAAELAAQLAEPDNLRAALAQLRPDELRLLQVTCLVADPTAPLTAIDAAYRTTGGSGAAPMDGLADLGLVALTASGWPAAPTFTVPREVAAQLPLRPDLVSRSPRRSTLERPEARGARLGIDELLAVLGHALRDGLPGPSPTSVAAADVVCPGWEMHLNPAEARQLEMSPGVLGQRGQEVRLLPIAQLGNDDLARLAMRTGQSTEAVAFGVQLLVSLGYVTGTRRLELQADRWRSFLAEPPGDRLSRLCRAWLESASWSELALVAGTGGPFHFRGRIGGYVDKAPLLIQHVARLRRLVARLLALLGHDMWYDTSSFSATIDGLAASALPDRPEGWSPETFGHLMWWLADRGSPRQPLALDQPMVRTRVHATLVSAMLHGPLNWLGLVDLGTEGNEPEVFRVTPGAGVVLGRCTPTGHLSPAWPGSLVVGDDASVTVRAGMPDGDVHTLLARVGQLVQGSAGGLRYRLTADRAQTAFDDGLSGPDVLRFLEERSSGSLPSNVRSTLERWWSDYGSVRLYDDLTLIELSADVLPAEILAAVPLLSQNLIYAFSPRVLAVEPVAADVLIEELVRLGYAPKVVDDGA